MARRFLKETKFLVFLSLGLLILDRFSKWFISNHPDLYLALPSFTKQNLGGQGDLIELKLFKNPNLYFIPLRDSFWLGFFYFLIGAVLLLLLFLFFKSWQKKDFLLMTGFSIIILGGLSNFFDRLYFGYVIDWLRVFFLPISVFNIADLMIVGGITVLLVKFIKK